MTEPKRTMMLSPYEWRSLVIASATNFYQYANVVTAAELPPTVEQVQWLHDTLNRLQMQVSAWSASGQPQQPAPTAASSFDLGHSTDMPLANGSGTPTTASGPKKKRGWQKGRKRGPRKPRTDEAVQ